jgi:hypothetical protein
VGVRGFLISFSTSFLLFDLFNLDDDDDDDEGTCCL